MHPGLPHLERAPNRTRVTRLHTCKTATSLTYLSSTSTSHTYHRPSQLKRQPPSESPKGFATQPGTMTIIPAISSEEPRGTSPAPASRWPRRERASNDGVSRALLARAASSALVTFAFLTGMPASCSAFVAPAVPAAAGAFCGCSCSDKEVMDGDYCVIHATAVVFAFVFDMWHSSSGSHVRYTWYLVFGLVPCWRVPLTRYCNLRSCWLMLL